MLTLKEAIYAQDHGGNIIQLNTWYSRTNKLQFNSSFYFRRDYADALEYQQYVEYIQGYVAIIKPFRAWRIQ